MAIRARGNAHAFNDDEDITARRFPGRVKVDLLAEIMMIRGEGVGDVVEGAVSKLGLAPGALNSRADASNCTSPSRCELLANLSSLLR